MKLPKLMILVRLKLLTKLTKNNRTKPKNQEKPLMVLIIMKLLTKKDPQIQ